MLGRRAVVATCTVALAVTGGGAAYAASHGSSNSKPATHAPSKQYSTRGMQGNHGGGNCPNMGNSPSSSNASAAL